MTHDQLIEGYAPKFSDIERFRLIKECKADFNLIKSDRHKLALYEHALECGIKEVKKRDGYEYSFFHDLKTLADLRQWHRLAAEVFPQKVTACGRIQVVRGTFYRVPGSE